VVVGGVAVVVVVVVQHLRHCPEPHNLGYSEFNNLMSVRHVTGNDKDYLRKSPEWFGRRPRLTKGHYRVYCQPMLPVKLEV
jgi:hypothetical protein